MVKGNLLIILEGYNRFFTYENIFDLFIFSVMFTDWLDEIRRKKKYNIPYLSSFNQN